MKCINAEKLRDLKDDFQNNKPFSHVVVDDFLNESVAIEASQSFPEYDSDTWHVYKNALEDKKTLNIWNQFNTIQYKVFSELNSPEFVEILEEMVGGKLHADHGLHGGGLHIHSNGGNLNPHLDYSIHPKTGLQRKLNIIIYLEEDFQASFGGSLGLWANESSDEPGELITEVTPTFNRAVIFDTTQNSWHGMSKKLALPNGTYRKSFAVYYMQEANEQTDTRSRALFAPREEQKTDEKVLDLIKMRADELTYANAYRKQQ